MTTIKLKGTTPTEEKKRLEHIGKSGFPVSGREYTPLNFEDFMLKSVKIMP